MFRRGGSTGEGITSGLRQGYENAGDVQPNLEQQALQNIINTPIELPKSTAGADFWLNLGTSILAQPGGRPILQTVGTAAQDPLKQFQQQRGQAYNQQMQMAQAAPGFQGQDISRLGSAGAIQQAQTQATLDAQREANRLAAYEPYERLGYMGAGIGNVLGGMQGQYQTTVMPNQSALQQAMGILGTGIGAYKTFMDK